MDGKFLKIQPTCIRLSIKYNLFPVQRVAKIEASRAAAIFFFSMKILSIFGGKKNCAKMISFFSPVAPFLATWPETELFLWTA